MVEVVAGLFLSNGKFMICKRSPHKARGLLWEFVGGKLEKGETKEQALKRECKEELGVEIKVGKEFMHVIHEYPDIKVSLTVFYAEIVSGEIKMLEHCDIKYISPKEIENYLFCPADTTILEKIKKEFI